MKKPLVEWHPQRIKQGREDIDVRGAPRNLRRREERGLVQDCRSAERFIERSEAVLEDSQVLTECFAVVADKYEDGPVEKFLRGKVLVYAFNLCIEHPQVVVVEMALVVGIREDLVLRPVV